MAGYIGEKREIFYLQASIVLFFHNYDSLINDNGLPMFDGENIVARVSELHFLSSASIEHGCVCDKFCRLGLSCGSQQGTILGRQTPATNQSNQSKQ